MALKHIGTLEAKTRLSTLLAEVQKGQRFCITKHGRPIAELRPIAKSRNPVKAGFAKGTFSYVAPDFDEEIDDFQEY